MGRVIGIDLGTTNSVAAITEKESRVLLNRESQDLTPSVVGVYRRQIRVGQLAVDQAPLAPKDTVASVKRLMGRGFRDKEVQAVRGKYSYEVVAPSDGTDEDVRVIMGGEQYSPIQISAMILKKIKEDAEMRLSDQVEYAVITVPAYFTEKQKDATRKAGLLAGLKVQKILDEPTAAAIAFGIDNVGPDDSKTILVYDLGGGTFDVSVLTIVGGIFVQLDIEGDMWLGGDDFDHKIVDHVVTHIQSAYGVDARKDMRFMVKLKEKAEQAKKVLSTMNRTEITIAGMLKDDQGELIDVELEITRTEFERMIAADVARSVELVRTAIRKAGDAMTPDQIDQVLLVGGSSYIPAVRKALAEVFGERKLLMNMDPMKCVAYGAAVLAKKWAEKVECPKGHVNPGKNTICEVENCGEVLVAAVPGGFEAAQQVTGMNYGIQAKGDKFEIIIPKGSSFPTPEPRKERFSTPAPNLKRIRVPIYAGFDPVASKNELQATVWLELPDKVPVDTPLEVAFSLDDDGILNKVRVALLDGSGVQVETYLDRGEGPRSRLEKKLDQLKKRKDQVRADLTPDVEARWESLYGEATKALSRNAPPTAQRCATEMEKLLQGGDPSWKKKVQGLCNYTEVVLQYSFLMDPPRVQQLKTLLEQTTRAIERDDQSECERLHPLLDKATDDLPAPLMACMTMIRAIGVAGEKGMVAEAEQLRGALKAMDSALRENDYKRAVDVLNGVAPVLTKVLGASAPPPSKDSLEDLVKK
jgi:molecular chaperone DnaK (HSP70)